SPAALPAPKPSSTPFSSSRKKSTPKRAPSSAPSISPDFFGVRQLAAAFTQSAHPAKSAAEGAPGTECVPGSWVALFRRVPQVPVLYLGLGLLFSAGCPRYRFCTWVLGSAWVASCARGGPAKNLFFPSTSW